MSAQITRTLTAQGKTGSSPGRPLPALSTRRGLAALAVLAASLALPACADAAAGSCGEKKPLATVDDRVVAGPLECSAPLGGETGVPTRARVGQIVRVHLPGIDGSRLHSSDPLTLVPQGDGAFRAALPGWAAIFLAVRPGENCVQPPRSCDVLSVNLVPR